jgi:hypothetical protein
MTAATTYEIRLRHADKSEEVLMSSTDGAACALRMREIQAHRAFKSGEEVALFSRISEPLGLEPPLRLLYTITASGRSAARY